MLHRISPSVPAVEKFTRKSLKQCFSKFSISTVAIPFPIISILVDFCELCFPVIIMLC